VIAADLLEEADADYRARRPGAERIKTFGRWAKHAKPPWLVHRV
jgi:hypothetical protein